MKINARKAYDVRYAKEHKGERSRRSNEYYILNKETVKAQRKEYHLTKCATLSYRFNRWKVAANRRGISWDNDLTIEYLGSLPLICYYTGIILTLEPKQPNTISLDRIDSSLGYTKDNVMFCLVEINLMKRDYSKERFTELCKMVSAHS